MKKLSFNFIIVFLIFLLPNLAHSYCINRLEMQKIDKTISLLTIIEIDEKEKKSL